jgi:hypothetical protein
MFIAAAPASVGNIVPETTLGQKPSGSACFQSCSIVTPPSSSAMPVLRSRARSLFIAEMSSTIPPALTLASP